MRKGKQREIVFQSEWSPMSISVMYMFVKFEKSQNFYKLLVKVFIEKNFGIKLY